MKVKWFALFILAVLCLNTASASVVIKKNLGLFGGHIEGLASFDQPGTPNRIYADVLGANALYFTDNYGLTWNLSIFAEDTFGIATDSTYVYVVVNNSEVWRSAGNDGITWTKILTPTTPGYFGEGITSISHDGVRLMLGCSNGVAYFNPTGSPAAWTRHVVKAGAGHDTAVMSLASRPTDPLSIYAVMNSMRNPDVSHNELFLSIDGGLTWGAVALPATITTAIEVVAEDPNFPGYVYLAGDSAFATIYENKNFLDPATWVNITPMSFEHHYPQYINFHNNRLWTTSHWYDVTTGVWHPLPNTTVGTHVNDGAIAFDADDPNIILMASDVGVAASIDGGITFEERNTGIAAVGVNDVDVDIITKDVALVASKSGLAITSVFQKPPLPSDWMFPVFPQGHGGPPLTACAILLDSTEEFLAGDGNETIYKSDNGGLTWRDVFHWVASPIPSRSTVTDIDHAAGSNVLYAALGFSEEGDAGIIVRSDDRGNTWTITNLTGVHPNALEIVGTQVVYVGVGHERDLPSMSNIGLWVTGDGGLTWSQVTSTAGPYIGIVNDIAQHPVNPQLQYITLQIGPSSGVVFEIEYDATGLNVVADRDLTMLPGAPLHGEFSAIETNDLGTEVYVGVNESIYKFDLTTNTWSLYFAGIHGERINRLYWDDLVMGTSTGFYSFVEEPTSVRFWPFHR